MRLAGAFLASAALLLPVTAQAAEATSTRCSAAADASIGATSDFDPVLGLSGHMTVHDQDGGGSAFVAFLLPLSDDSYVAVQFVAAVPDRADGTPVPLFRTEIVRYDAEHRPVAQSEPVWSDLRDTSFSFRQRPGRFEIAIDSIDFDGSRRAAATTLAVDAPLAAEIHLRCQGGAFSLTRLSQPLATPGAPDR